MYFQQLNISPKFPESLLDIFLSYVRYFGNLKLFGFMPIIYTVFLFYCGALFIRIFRKKQITFPEKYFITWAVSGILYLGFFAYSPPRFSLVLIPAIIVLVSIFLMNYDFKLHHKSLIALIIVITIICTFQIIFGIYRIIRDQTHFLSCYLPLLSIPTIIVLILLKNDKALRKLLLAGIITINLWQIGYYHFSIDFSYYNAIKDMEKLIKQYPGSTKVIAGDIAPLVATELQMKAVSIVFQPEKERARFLSQRPSFLVLQDNKYLLRLQEKMPEYLYDITLLKTYHIFKNYKTDEDTYFYRINVVGN
jgi:hypothetical protein